MVSIAGDPRANRIVGAAPWVKTPGMRARLLTACLALAGLACLARAETLTIPEANCSVEAPDGWSREDIKSALGPRVTVRAPDRKSWFTVLTLKRIVRGQDMSKTLKTAYDGARKGVAQARPQTLQEGVVDVAGLRFYTASGELKDGSSSVGWHTGAGDWVYSVITRGPKDDEVLAKVRQSFRLLQPATATTGFVPEKYVHRDPYEAPSWFEQNFRAIYVIGGTVVLLIGSFIMNTWKARNRNS